MTSSPAGGDADFSTLLELMDAVDELRHGEQALADLARQDESRETLKARLRQTYAGNGINLKEDMLDKAVSAHLQHRFQHQPPPESIALRLARLYVRRGRWGGRLVTGLLLGLGTIGLYQATVMLPAQAEHRARVERAEASVATLGQRLEAARETRAALEQELKALPAAPQAVHGAQKRLAEQARQVLAEAGRGLERLGRQPALLAHGPDETQPQREAQISERDQALVLAEQQLDSARLALGNARELGPTLERLDEGWQRLQTLPLPALIGASAQTQFNKARLALGTGDLAGGRAGVTALETLASQGTEMAGLAQEIDTLLAAVRKTRPREQDLKTALASAESARQALERVDLDAARTGRDDLQSLLLLLQSDITLRIVNVPGSKSAIWRETDGQPRSYYLIVDALTASGEAVKVPVLDAERQQVEQVSRLGVRVPESTYEAVRADKLDDGRIEHDTVGHKPRGSSKVDYVLPVAGGLITRW